MPEPPEEATQEDNFAKLLQLLPVVLTADHTAGKVKAKSVTTIILHNSGLFWRMQVRQLYQQQVDGAQRKRARLQKKGVQPTWRMA